MPNHVGSLDAWLENPCTSSSVGASAPPWSHTGRSGPKHSLPAGASTAAELAPLCATGHRTIQHEILATSTILVSEVAGKSSRAASVGNNVLNDTNTYYVVLPNSTSPKRKSLLSEQLRTAASVPLTRCDHQSEAATSDACSLNEIFSTPRSGVSRQGRSAERVCANMLQAFKAGPETQSLPSLAVVACNSEAIDENGITTFPNRFEGVMPSPFGALSSLSKERAVLGSMDADTSMCGGGTSLACSSSSAGCYSSGSNFLHGRGDRDDGSGKLLPAHLHISSNLLSQSGAFAAATTEETFVSGVADERAEFSAGRQQQSFGGCWDSGSQLQPSPLAMISFLASQHTDELEARPLTGAFQMSPVPCSIALAAATTSATAQVGSSRNSTSSGCGNRGSDRLSIGTTVLGSVTVQVHGSELHDSMNAVTHMEAVATADSAAEIDVRATGVETATHIMHPLPLVCASAADEATVAEAADSRRTVTLAAEGVGVITHGMDLLSFDPGNTAAYGSGGESLLPDARAVSHWTDADRPPLLPQQNQRALMESSFKANLQTGCLTQPQAQTRSAHKNSNSEEAAVTEGTGRGQIAVGEVLFVSRSTADIPSDVVGHGGCSPQHRSSSQLVIASPFASVSRQQPCVRMGNAQWGNACNILELAELWDGNEGAATAPGEPMVAGVHDASLREARRSFDVLKELSRTRSTGVGGTDCGLRRSKISGLLEGDVPPALYEGTVRHGLPRKASVLVLARAMSQPTSAPASASSRAPFPALISDTAESAKAMSSPDPKKHEIVGES